MKPVEKMFSEKGSWFKGNLHSHTVNSDGRLTPAQSAAYYREHGYSFICFSEHDYYTDLRKILDRDDFIILPGLEASTYLITSDDFSGLFEPEVLQRGYCDMTFQELMAFRNKNVNFTLKKAHISMVFLEQRKCGRLPEKMFLRSTSFIRSVFT